MNRRKFLTVTGGGLILAAGAATAYVSTATPNAALKPWSAAGASSYTDPRLRALSYAILAPNPHNLQPWKVALEGENQVRLSFDTDRQLPHTDPFDRQLTIGLGCFLELMTMAANTDGYRVELSLFPEGSAEEGLDTRPVALAQFVKDETLPADPLWAFVMQRRSNKDPFDTTRNVSQETLAGVLGVGKAGTRLGGTVDPGEIKQWRDLTQTALEIEIETPRTYKESVDVFRIGKTEVNANPDGIDFSGPLFETLHLTGQFTRESALDRSSSAYTQGRAAVLANCSSAMGHVWMITDGNTRQDQIAAGADWLRINLATTRAGLGFQPLSQALQEYPEMQEIYRDVHARLAPEGGTVQMLSRIGYGADVPVSPRWPLEAKLVAA